MTKLLLGHVLRKTVHHLVRIYCERFWFPATMKACIDQWRWSCFEFLLRSNFPPWIIRRRERLIRDSFTRILHCMPGPWMVGKNCHEWCRPTTIIVRSLYSGTVPCKRLDRPVSDWPEPNAPRERKGLHNVAISVERVDAVKVFPDNADAISHELLSQLARCWCSGVSLINVPGGVR